MSKLNALPGGGWGVIKTNLAGAKTEIDQQNILLRRLSIGSILEEKKKEAEEKKEDPTVARVAKGPEVPVLVPLMRPDRTVKREDSLAVVVNIMAAEKKGRVFILDNQRCPVGVIVLADICKLVIDQCEIDVVKLQEKEKTEDENEGKMTAEDVVEESSAEAAAPTTKERGASFHAGGDGVAPSCTSSEAASDEAGGDGEGADEAQKDAHRVSLSLESELLLVAPGASRKRADTGQLYDEIELSHSEGPQYLGNLTEGDENEEDDD